MSDLLATPYLSVAFPVQGTHLPADHGYSLYAAIIQTLPALHGSPWLGIELISGIPWDKGMIALPTYGTSYVLRLPVQHFATVSALSG